MLLPRPLRGKAYDVCNTAVILTIGYANNQFALQTPMGSITTLQSLLQHPLLTMFDPP